MYMYMYKHAASGLWYSLAVALKLTADLIQPNRPVVIRPPRSQSDLIAGIRPHDHADDSLVSLVRSLWRQEANHRPMHLAGWRPQAGYLWGERVRTLASLCQEAAWGHVPHDWEPVPRLLLLPNTNDECPVCMESYRRPPAQTGRGAVRYDPQRPVRFRLQPPCDMHGL